jgi:hypothetical protein
MYAILCNIYKFMQFVPTTRETLYQEKPIIENITIYIWNKNLIFQTQNICNKNYILNMQIIYNVT